MITQNLGKIAITPKGQWVADVYERLDLVTSAGSSYISLKDNNVSALNTADWMLVAGKGDAFEYSDFTPEQLEALKGDTGTGIQSIALTSTVGRVKTYTITFTDLTTTTFSVEDGEGLDGKSAYQIWIDLGNEGTEQDFINSLASGGIDLSAYLTELEAQGLYQPIGNYLTDETDPTVPDWAKEATKPTYTAAEVGAAETDHSHDDLHTLEDKITELQQVITELIITLNDKGILP